MSRPCRSKRLPHVRRQKPPAKARVAPAKLWRDRTARARARRPVNASLMKRVVIDRRVLLAIAVIVRRALPVTGVTVRHTPAIAQRAIAAIVRHVLPVIGATARLMPAIVRRAIAVIVRRARLVIEVIVRQATGVTVRRVLKAATAIAVTRAKNAAHDLQQRRIKPRCANRRALSKSATKPA